MLLFVVLVESMCVCVGGGGGDSGGGFDQFLICCISAPMIFFIFCPTCPKNYKMLSGFFFNFEE